MSNRETTAKHQEHLWKCVTNYYAEPVALTHGEGFRVRY